jgi:hypothetical protein
MHIFLANDFVKDGVFQVRFVIISSLTRAVAVAVSKKKEL